MLRRIFSKLSLALALAACSTGSDSTGTGSTGTGDQGAGATASGAGAGSVGGTSSGASTGGMTADASASGGSMGGSPGGSKPSDASEAGEAGGDAPALPVLFVAPDGQGSDCSEKTPCALTAARDQARALKPRNGPLVIRLHGGTYALSKAFQLEETDVVHDSGVPGGSTVYASAPGGTPRLTA